MNLTEYSVATNVKLTKPQANLLAKLDAMGVTIFVTGSVAVTNPTNGLTRYVDALTAALINWVYKVYSTYGFSGEMNYRGTKVAIGTFDRVRYLILAIDKHAFRDFID